MRAQTASTIMRRRDFVTVLTGVAATWPVTALAQQLPAVPVVGYLNGASAAQFPQLLAGFPQRVGRNRLFRRPQRGARISLRRGSIWSAARTGSRPRDLIASIVEERIASNTPGATLWWMAD